MCSFLRSSILKMLPRNLFWGHMFLSAFFPVFTPLPPKVRAPNQQAWVQGSGPHPFWFGGTTETHRPGFPPWHWHLPAAVSLGLLTCKQRQPRDNSCETGQRRVVWTPTRVCSPSKPRGTHSQMCYLQKSEPGHTALLDTLKILCMPGRLALKSDFQPWRV